MKTILVLMSALLLSACGGSNMPLRELNGAKTEHKIILSPGVEVSSEPLQTKLDAEKAFDFKGYAITPLATFEIDAKVLSRKNYSNGKEAQLSPTDLALGWQNMSDEKNLEQISIWQSKRWYHWRVDEFPIPRQEINSQSANMHMIPADDGVEEQLNKIKKGQIVSITGYLVRVDDYRNPWSWKSSLTRDDTGDGACEVVYVTELSLKK